MNEEENKNDQHCPNYKLFGFCKQYSKCKFFLFHKTCKSYLLSSCSKGKTCPFFHDLTEKSNFTSLNEKKKIDLTSSKTCKTFKEKGICQLDQKCPNFYFHQECKFFSKGKCDKEGTCMFYHNENKNRNFNNLNSPKKWGDKGDSLNLHNKLKKGSHTENLNLCCICCIEKADHVALPCGHVGYCFKCGEKLEKCGICRKKIEIIQKIYFS